MRRVKGRLVFQIQVGSEDRPIANASLQLWDLDVIVNDYLAHGVTDENGEFDIEYDPDVADRWGDKPDLVLRLMDREYEYDAMGQPVSKWHVVQSFHGGDDITDDVFDFGTLRASFWEYASGEQLDDMAFTPRVAVYDGRTPQDHRPGRTLEQLQVAARNLPAHTRHQLIAKFSHTHPTPQEIEADYPENETRELGEAARADAFICDLVLNGFNPCVLKKGDAADTYYAAFRWNGLQQDATHFSPNTTAHFKVGENGLELESIDLQKRLGGDDSAHARYRKAKRYTPAGDKKEWERVKRLFRCNYFLFGEVATHLAETHLNVEQYIVAMRRNLLQNPVARLLFPHFFGTTAVNLSANHVLLANEGIVQKCSALTQSSVREAAALAFGTYNWKEWRPRAPLTDQHHYAKIGQLYWKILEEYVAKFFVAEDVEIRKYWAEIKRMSDELVGHALPFLPSDDDSFYDAGEINTGTKLHPRVDGVPVAISPVTGSEVADAEGIANLKQLCAYLLFHATFKHAWVNDHQYMMGGEIGFATLGVTDDISNLRVDENAVVPPDEAIEHPFITYILNFTEYGYIIRNEDDDMNPDLIRAILEKRHDFAALNYDVKGLRSCINT